MQKISKVVSIIGIVCILLAVLLNPFVLKYLSDDNNISTTGIILLLFLELVLLTLGIYLYLKPEGYKNVILFLVVCLLIWFPLDYVVAKLKLASGRDTFYTEQFRQMDEVYHHSFKPNTSGYLVTPEFKTAYNINSQGLRNPEISSKKEKIRILVLGDSFTEGWGVDYNDTSSKKLNDYLGENFEVINAGVVSYSPTPEYLYLINKGINLEPDIVILNYDNSDIRGDIDYLANSKFAGDGSLIAISPPPVTILDKLWFTNWFFHAAKKLLMNLSTNGRKAPKEDVYLPYVYTAIASCNEFENEWKYSFKYISKIKDYLDSRGIPFIIVIYPYGHQVATNQWVTGRKGIFRSDMVYPFALADCFENYTYGEELTVFNLLFDFRNQSEITNLYYDYDLHMNKEGYGLIVRGYTQG